MATAVGPWSTRAREGGTIATPLGWNQLRESLRPADFNLANINAVLKVKDPWKDLADSAAPLEDARRRLAKL